MVTTPPIKTLIIETMPRDEMPMLFTSKKNCFLYTENFSGFEKKLKAGDKPQWGVLSAQGMVEHMTDSIGIAWERLKEPMQTHPESLEKAKGFAMSDKPFKPNTKNTYMSETPAPLRNANME